MKQMIIKEHKGSQGFTLVELMVVVIVIGILASLATWGYTSYMNQAKVTRLKSYVMSLAAKQTDAMGRQVMVPFNIGPYDQYTKRAYENILGFSETVYPGIEIDTEAWTSNSGGCQRCGQYNIPAPRADQAGFMAVARQDIKEGGDRTTVYITNETAGPIERNVGE